MSFVKRIEAATSVVAKVKKKKGAKAVKPKAAKAAKPAAPKELTMLDTAFIKYVKSKAKDFDGIAAQLQLAASKGNAKYLKELQKDMGAKNLAELANKILAFKPTK